MLADVHVMAIHNVSAFVLGGYPNITIQKKQGSVSVTFSNLQLYFSNNAIFPMV